MRYLFLIMVTVLSQQIQASDRILLDCRTIKVFNTLLEESLSVEEYPEVILTQSEGELELVLGANHYAEVEGDLFESLPSVNGEKAYRISPSTGAEPLVIRISKITRKGVVYFISYNKQGKKRLVKLASLKCNK